MKKKFISIIAVLCICMTIFPLITEEADAASIPSINDKSVYRVTKYVSGDCNLCSQAYMLRRMSILLKSPKWSYITNNTMRGIASYDDGDGHCNDVCAKYNFTNKNDGINFSVKSAALTGTTSNKITKLKNLLKTHPEGIVVWGPNAMTGGGSHAVLITGYSKKGGFFYCADSAYNYGSYNKGIIKFSNSKMRGISYCTRYYYLSASSLKQMNKPVVKKYNSANVSVKWIDIYGQNRYQLSKATIKSGTNVIATYRMDKSGTKIVKASPNKTYYYKMRAYNYFTYKDWEGKEHEKYVYSKWSSPTVYKFK